jgi:hypothetical protein
MVNICHHDETWLGYGTSVEPSTGVIVGFANQTQGICWDVVGICGHVVITTSVLVVASVGFAGRADCAKGNAIGGCTLIASLTKFYGQGIYGYPSGIYENELVVGATRARGQQGFIGHPCMYGGGHDPPISQHPCQFVGIVAFWATADRFVGIGP